jgi:lipoate-protein ligase A
LVARALNSEPVSLLKSDEADIGDGAKGAYVNGRNDICIALKNRKPAERKISGSAYKIISSRAYHHGTMLLTSNLSHLGSALKPSRTTMQSKGVESVPSPVSNLVDAFHSRRLALSHDQFCEAVLAEFQRTYGEASVSHVGERDYKEILEDHKGDLEAGRREMDSWDWTWGQTPEFHHRIRSEGLQDVPGGFEIDLHVKNGIIQSAELRCDTATEDVDLSKVVKRLIGKQYNVFGDAPDTYGDISKKPVDGLKELQYEDQRNDRQVQLAKGLLAWFKEVL